MTKLSGDNKKRTYVKIDTIKSNTKMYRIYKGHKKGI